MSQNVMNIDEYLTDNTDKINELKDREALIGYMINLQSDADKKKKRQTYKDIEVYVDTHPLSDECVGIILIGTENNGRKLLGLCELTSKKNSRDNFKDSTNEFIKLIYHWMFESKPKIQDDLSTKFSFCDDLKKMKLGEHYKVLSSSNKSVDKELAQKIPKIVYKLMKKRPLLEISDIIEKIHVDRINTEVAKLRKSEMEVEEVQKKIEEEEDKEQQEKLELNNINVYSREPKYWSEAENKKLLNLDFITKQINDEENDEEEKDLNDNFIDPFNINNNLDIKKYDDEQLKKLHIQMETFSPKAFLEEFYKNASLERLQRGLKEYELNCKEENDDKIIDQNIYKYLDCKNLLDKIQGNIDEEINNSLINFNKDATTFISEVEVQLKAMNQPFETIKNSRTAKKILLKFSEYFKMKESVDEYLKYSNIDKLATSLEKINKELENIPQKMLIFNKFYKYFHDKIGDFKKSIIKKIEKAEPNDKKLLDYFKYLINFNVDWKTIDNLIKKQKEKMCDKIKNYFDLSSDLETQNYKDFFCEDCESEKINDKEFNDLLLEEAKKEGNKILISTKRQKVTINIKSIIRTITSQIFEFLSLMKILDSILNMKAFYEKDTKGFFDSICQEVFKTLYSQLMNILFTQNFSLETLIKKDYPEIYKFEKNKYINEFIKFYKDKNLSNTIFNESFSQHSLLQLPNLIIDIFEDFKCIFKEKEKYDEEINKNKQEIVEKLFISFINVEIDKLMSLLSQKKNFNFEETQMTINNFSTFFVTKEFIKKLYESCISIIKFYMNIIYKFTDANLDHKYIYLSFFFALKLFLIQLKSCYDTKRDTEDKITLNCHIVEILRNYNYIQNEVKSICKFLFRSKNKNYEKDYEEYLNDINLYIDNLKDAFKEEYIENFSEHLFYTFTNQTNQNNDFYENYNKLLISGDINPNNFIDSRSVLIDMITSVVNCVRHFDMLFNNEILIKDENEVPDLKQFLKKIILAFLNKITQYCKDSEKVLLINENKDEFNILKYFKQLNLELETFIKCFSIYCDEIKDDVEKAKKSILSLICKIKKCDSSKIYTRNEEKTMKEFIKNYLNNYKAIFKWIK